MHIINWQLKKAAENILEHRSDGNCDFDHCGSDWLYIRVNGDSRKSVRALLQVRSLPDVSHHVTYNISIRIYVAWF
jgi:hypothetical protein